MMFAASSPSCAATTATDDLIGAGQIGVSATSSKNPVHQSPSSSHPILSSSSTPLAAAGCTSSIHSPPPTITIPSSMPAVGDMWSSALKGLIPTAGLQNAAAFMPSSSTATMAQMPPMTLPFSATASGNSPAMMALYYQQLMQAALPPNQQQACAMQQFLQQLAFNQTGRHNTPDAPDSCNREGQSGEAEQYVKVNDFVNERHQIVSKLKMSPDGKMCCPICEKSLVLSATDWRSHLEQERDSLKKLVESIRSTMVGERRVEAASASSSSLGQNAAQRKSRELGLVAIRNRRVKRLAARPHVPVSSSVCSPVTPSSRAGTSPLKCATCGLCAEFLIIGQHLEESGRCWRCFGWRERHPPFPVPDSVSKDTIEKPNGVKSTDSSPLPAAAHNGSGKLRCDETIPECHNGNGGVTNGGGGAEMEDLKSWDLSMPNGLRHPVEEQRPPSKRSNGNGAFVSEIDPQLSWCPTMVVKRSRIDGADSQ